MKIFGKCFAGIIGTAAAIILAASLALAGEARMLTDEELDQITGANFNIDFENIDFEFPRKFEEMIARVPEQATGSEAASGFGAVNVGNASNSLIITQSNIVLLSGSGGGASIRQVNVVNFGDINK